jgi:hypothetical protein
MTMTRSLFTFEVLRELATKAGTRKFALQYLLTLLTLLYTSLISIGFGGCGSVQNTVSDPGIIGLDESELPDLVDPQAPLLRGLTV